MEEDAECAKLKIPARLHRLKRAEISEFEPPEELYRRVNPARVKDEGLAMAAISFHGNGMSVNRQGSSAMRLCKCPEDVLFDTKAGNHRNGWSILTFEVERVIQFRWEHPDTQKQFTLELKHDPEACMYPHSGICLIYDGAQREKVSGSKKFSLELKDRVAALARRKDGCSVPQD
jgi:hypothetical protein